MFCIYFTGSKTCMVAYLTLSGVGWSLVLNCHGNHTKPCLGKFRKAVMNQEKRTRQSDDYSEYNDSSKNTLWALTVVVSAIEGGVFSSSILHCYTMPPFLFPQSSWPCFSPVFPCDEKTWQTFQLFWCWSGYWFRSWCGHSLYCHLYGLSCSMIIEKVVIKLVAHMVWHAVTLWSIATHSCHVLGLVIGQALLVTWKIAVSCTSPGAVCITSRNRRH